MLSSPSARRLYALLLCALVCSSHVSAFNVAIPVARPASKARAAFAPSMPALRGSQTFRGALPLQMSENRNEVGRKFDAASLLVFLPSRKHVGLSHVLGKCESH
jgi:hypothetical protein